MICQGNKNCTQPLKNDVLKKTFISVERLREARTLSSMPYKLIEACKPMLNLTRITLGEVNGTQCAWQNKIQFHISIIIMETTPFIKEIRSALTNKKKHKWKCLKSSKNKQITETCCRFFCIWQINGINY